MDGSHDDTKQRVEFASEELQNKGVNQTKRAPGEPAWRASRAVFIKSRFAGYARCSAGTLVCSLNATELLVRA